MHNKGWNSGTNPARVEPLTITLIKETYDGNSDEDFVKLKLSRDTTSITLDLYDFNMSFFNHGKTEDFLLFICNLNMTLVAIGMLEMEVKIQYLCMLVLG